MSTVHVIPLGDPIRHDIPGGYDQFIHEARGWLAIEALGDDTSCSCGPLVEWVSNPDGPDGWLVTHHSLDGREQWEVAA